MRESGKTDLETAVRCVAEAHRLLEQQYRRIAKLKERGKPTFKAEQMLRVLENTLQIFETESGLQDGAGASDPAWWRDAAKRSRDE